MKSICVFAGSSYGARPSYRETARQLGEYMGTHGYRLVYGGSKTGLMGEVANAALAHGGEVVGIMPSGLAKGEIVHTALTEYIEVDSMHERKAMMHSLADGYIALPGGFGTFEELFEALCWSQIGIHQHPIGLLNVDGYYDLLLKMVEHSMKEGFAPPTNMSLMSISATPHELIHSMSDYLPPNGQLKWQPKNNQR